MFPPDRAHFGTRSPRRAGAKRARGLAQSNAAKLLGVTQPRVSDLLRGRIDLFSTDTLVDMLARVGIGVRVVLKPRRPRSAA